MKRTIVRSIQRHSPRGLPYFPRVRGHKRPRYLSNGIPRSDLGDWFVRNLRQ